MNNTKKAINAANSAEKKKPMLKSLRILRGISGLSVFLYHAIRTFPGEGWLFDFFSKPLGPWSVSVFLVLSGFVMTYSYWDRPPSVLLRERGAFALKKISHLYPLHVVMLLVGTIRLTIRGEEWSELFKDLLLTIPLLQTWFPFRYQAINTVAWYLSATMFLYFLFPILLQFLKESNRKRVWMMFIMSVVLREIIGYGIFRFSSLDIKWLIYCHPLSRTVDFAAGGLLASIYMSSDDYIPVDSFSRSFMLFFSFLICFASCIVFIHLHQNMPWFTYADLFLVPNLFLVSICVINERFISGLKLNKPFGYMADINPYFFLSHRLIINCFYDTVLYRLKTDVIPRFVSVLIPFVLSVVFAGFYSKMERFLNKEVIK